MCPKGFKGRFPLSKLNKKSTQKDQMFGYLQKMRYQQKNPRSKGRRG
jgi:hypothetical protein